MTEPITVINLISMPADAADGFLQGWTAATFPLRNAPGFRGTRLLRALDPDEPYQVVNVAQWDSVEQWQAALAPLQPNNEQRRQAEAAGISPRHAFYRVIAATPDPAHPTPITEHGDS